MMNRAAVASTLFVALSATAAYAEGETTTTTAGTVVVVTPNAPVVVTNGAAPATAQTPAAPPSIDYQIQPPGAAEMPPTPPAAPQNEDWNNVSHINGHPVPVGERGAYLYSFRKNNLQTNPLGWMFGFYQVAGSHAVSENVAVSVEVSGWNYDNGNRSGYQLAATLPIYFRRTYSGPFLEAGLVIHHDNDPGYVLDCYDCSSTDSNDWVGPEVMLGWSWIFDSGLNMSFAFGAAKKMTDSMSSSSYSSSDEPQPAGYFRVGYAF